MLLAFLVLLCSAVSVQSACYVAARQIDSKVACERYFGTKCAHILAVIAMLDLLICRYLSDVELCLPVRTARCQSYKARTRAVCLIYSCVSPLILNEHLSVAEKTR